MIGPYLGNVITEPMARQLQTVNGLATTLIALHRRARRSTSSASDGASRGTTRMIVTTLAITMAGLFAVAWLAWPWLPIAPEAAGTAKLAMVALFVVIVVSFSPTMTAAVISETGARGRLSDLVLAIVVVADLVALVLFSLALQLARVALGEGARLGRQRARPAGLGDRRRDRVRQPGRRAVRAVPALRRRAR